MNDNSSVVDTVVSGDSSSSITRSDIVDLNNNLKLIHDDLVELNKKEDQQQKDLDKFTSDLLKKIDSDSKNMNDHFKKNDLFVDTIMKDRDYVLDNTSLLYKRIDDYVQYRVTDPLKSLDQNVSTVSDNTTYSNGYSYIGVVGFLFILITFIMYKVIKNFIR